MDQPFIYKYRPQTLKDFEIDPKIIELLNTLIQIDTLNVLLVGDSGCGKTSLINCIIKEYYGNDYNSTNILTINSLKDQGISYYRSEVKTFCQTMSTIPNKKKFVVLDDIDNINEQSQQVFRNCIDKYSKNVKDKGVRENSFRKNNYKNMYNRRIAY
jgi:replication factor C small subunit